MKPAKYTTDIRLGERYVDKQTGIEGTVTAVTFYQFGCERANVEVVANGEVKDYGFDAPRLTHMATQTPVASIRTGGPDRGVSHVRPGVVTR